MRTAYRGRAAAYEHKGEYAKALADHDLVITYYAVELEILNELDGPGRDALLAEAAAAYRARGECLAKLDRTDAATRDRKHADGLQARAKELAARTTTGVTAKKEAAPADGTDPAVPAGHVRLVNAWSAAVTVVVDGATHRLEAGEQKTIAVPGGAVTVQVLAGPFQQTTTLQARRSYTIR